MPTGTCGIGAASGSVQPTIAITQNDGAHTNAYVLEWDGEDWKPLGGQLNPVSGQNVSSVFMSRNAQGPVVIMLESDATRVNAYVHQWTGHSWIPLGAAINPTGAATIGSSFIEGYGDDGVFITLNKAMESFRTYTRIRGRARPGSRSARPSMP